MYYKCLWAHWYAAAPELQASVATAEWDQESALFFTPTGPFQDSMWATVIVEDLKGRKDNIKEP